VACEPPRLTAYCPLLFYRNDGATASFRRTAASGLYMSSWRQPLEQHRPSIGQRVTPSGERQRLCRPRRDRSVSRLCYRCQKRTPFSVATLVDCLPPGRAEVNVTRSLPSRPSATDLTEFSPRSTVGLLEACIAVRRFVSVTKQLRRRFSRVAKRRIKPPITPEGWTKRRAAGHCPVVGFTKRPAAIGADIEASPTSQGLCP
jgi:hypothetical protein